VDSGGDVEYRGTRKDWDERLIRNSGTRNFGRFVGVVFQKRKWWNGFFHKREKGGFGAVPYLVAECLADTGPGPGGVGCSLPLSWCELAHNLIIENEWNLCILFFVCLQRVRSNFEKESFL
jgi:hypothetical protein